MTQIPTQIPVATAPADPEKVMSLKNGRKPKASTVYAEGERPSLAARIATWVFMIAITLYFLVPVYWLVVASTKTTTDLFGTPGFLFADMNFFENLQKLSTYDNGIFWRWMGNSLIYSGLGSVLMTFISLISGYALAMYRFRGRSVVIAAVLGSMLIPQTVLAQPTYLLLVELGMNNTILGVLLPSLAYPFGVLLAFVFAQQAVPMELLEAARLDGASEARAFFSIALKLLSPGGVTILLFAFIGSWNNFMLPLLVISDARLMPVTVGLSGWSQASITIPGLQTLVVIGALISIIPIIIVFVSLQRYWRSGLAAGGVRF
ncbi:carbohydrate ABC transporter permease [Agromyces atrinae]|uniref:carbohydrate ABC transporter permease n=1 Tax=Agromyces atrinae TaxID=592376 RepID=UPI001F59C3C6|nr:carbohydrate ABC transporter permease [Agromyces atrinae]MCI2957620.1 carbohydrate ABC transporter permease [Agromyces atrinae]